MGEFFQVKAERISSLGIKQYTLSRKSKVEDILNVLDTKIGTLSGLLSGCTQVVLPYPIGCARRDIFCLGYRPNLRPY